MVTPSTCSPDTLTLYNVLPEYVKDADAANDYLFLTYLEEAAGGPLQVIDDLVRDDGNVPGWSILLDVSRCPTYALPWLGQFVGTRFTGNPTDAQMRATLLAPPGWTRGTVGAIAGAASPWMKAGYSVTVVERTPDPYSIHVYVPSAGILGYSYGTVDTAYTPYWDLDSQFATYGDWATNTAALEAAIFASIPAGIVCTISYV